MGRFKIKRDKYDITFAKFIKLRDVVCQRCGKSTGQLECSHIFSRKNQGTRCDPDNAKLLCSSCHQWWHSNPTLAAEWLMEIIGQAKYDKLRLKANRVTKLSVFDRDHIRQEHIDNIKKIEAGFDFDCFNFAVKRFL